ncbi:hypothetical protein [Vitiosangium sp. GDMCC 1.1324]|uniref:hypothetical protein n=1 Tax=Vitiosangium sp. (strain GDMCC 1.1324) TaxID=2138576 RepID=UPI000D3C02DC|nr:hypothetical protein [Vitiosangium sp. GDMCC 1.1324]PTL83277.1 hypothetical protein DAT35_14915 [Vitiosangium sp. GDMCC 1.1324]
MRHTAWGLGITVALALGSLLGCGGTTDLQTGEDGLSQVEQQLLPCASGYTCSAGYTCVQGTCRPECGAPPVEVPVKDGRVAAESYRDTLSIGSCASGYKCCPGYYYSEDRVTNPYCLPNAGSCATFP